MGEDSGWAWRVALGLGALPGIALAPFKTADAKPQGRRLERVELVTATRDTATGETSVVETVESDEPTSASAQPSLLAVLQRRDLWGKLIGTAGGWFIFDITFYGNLLFQPIVLSQVFDAKGKGSSCSGDLQSSLCDQVPL